MMQTLRKRSLLLTLGLVLLLFVSACGTGGGSDTGDVLKKSAEAMQKLQSSHFAFTLSLTSNLGNLLPSGSDVKGDASTSDSNLTVTAKGTGQVQTPDQSASDIQVQIPSAGQNQALQSSLVTKDKKFYFTGSDGQWYYTDLSNAGISNSLFSSIQVTNYNKLLELGDKAKLTDHGTQNRNGENLRHITLTFDKAAVKDVLDKLGLMTDLSADEQQNVNQFLNLLTIKTLTFDTWIDENTSYVHHLDFNADLSLDLSSLLATLKQHQSMPTLPSTVTLKLVFGADLSKFNEPVQVNVPANATPTDDLSKLFAH